MYGNVAGHSSAFGWDSSVGRTMGGTMEWYELEQYDISRTGLMFLAQEALKELGWWRGGRSWGPRPRFRRWIRKDGWGWCNRSRVSLMDDWGGSESNVERFSMWYDGYSGSTQTRWRWEIGNSSSRTHTRDGHWLRDIITTRTPDVSGACVQQDHHSVSAFPFLFTCAPSWLRRSFYAQGPVFLIPHRWFWRVLFDCDGICWRKLEPWAPFGWIVAHTMVVGSRYVSGVDDEWSVGLECRFFPCLNDCNSLYHSALLLLSVPDRLRTADCRYSSNYPPVGCD